MGAIPPMEFIKYFVDQGHEFNIGIMDDGELTGEVVHVNRNNFEEFADKFGKNDDNSV